jgi:hypothetical protein
LKKHLIFSFILIFLLLTGCNIKGEYDIKGTVMEVERSSILVEDEKLGLIWLTLPDGTDGQDFENGQTVEVWTDGNSRVLSLTRHCLKY